MKSILQLVRDTKDFMYAMKHYKDGGRLFFTGNVRCEHFRGDQCLHSAWEPEHNIFTTEGMAYLNNLVFYNVSKPSLITVSFWYVGIFKGNITPALGDTAAAKLGSGGTYQECQDADYGTPATTKPEYITASTSSAVITNSASKASFTMAGSITVYGAFLGTTGAKATASGTLMCAKTFTSSRAVVLNDVLAVTYQITLSSS
jgi:hypothetical protein